MVKSGLFAKTNWTGRRCENAPYAEAVYEIIPLAVRVPSEIGRDR